MTLQNKWMVSTPIIVACQTPDDTPATLKEYLLQNDPEYRAAGMLAHPFICLRCSYFLVIAKAENLVPGRRNSGELL